jgi:ribosome-binding factor A
MKTHRLARVAEAIRETASQTILFEVRDPRVKGVTVTRAEVSGDLQHAKIYVSIMGTPREQQLCLHGLKHSAGFIQSKLAARLQTRFTPQVEFVLDEGVKKSIEMTRLINEALGHPATPAEVEEGEEAEDETPPRSTEDRQGRAETADGTAEEERGNS